VTVDGQLISSIGKGLLVFAGVGKDDTVKDAESMASKVLKMKLWEDENGGKVCPWNSLPDLQLD
jgi:D-Tyr-tRNAtyr deacylase